MRPNSNSDCDLLVYADYLLDEGREAEADDIRRGVAGAEPARSKWHYLYRPVVGGGVGGGSVGGVGGVGGSVVGVGGSVVGVGGGGSVGGVVGGVGGVGGVGVGVGVY